MFIQHLLSGNYIYFFGVIFAVTFSVCLHEYAHAITAYKMGDDTAARKGIYPESYDSDGADIIDYHVPDWHCLWCCTGKTLRFAQKKHGEAIVALAGPATKLAVVCDFWNRVGLDDQNEQPGGCCYGNIVIFVA